MKQENAKAVIIIGSPGSGKSTLISFIKHPAIIKIKVGVILRNCTKIL